MNFRILAFRGMLLSFLFSNIYSWEITTIFNDCTTQITVELFNKSYKIEPQSFVKLNVNFPRQRQDYFTEVPKCNILIITKGNQTYICTEGTYQLLSNSLSFPATWCFGLKENYNTPKIIAYSYGSLNSKNSDEFFGSITVMDEDIKVTLAAK